MEGAKLDISGGKKSDDSPPASYTAISEKDMEEETASRPKSLVKVKTASPEADGADEKMLPKEDTKISPNSNISTSKVKISLDNHNGDAKLDIDDIKPAFVGLTKEELMKYANDPFWVRLRMTLFVGFWILWALMLVGAVAIIYTAPKCPAPPPKEWWEVGPLVEVPSDVTLDQLKSPKYADFKGFIQAWNEDAYAAVDDSHQIMKLLKGAKENTTNVVLVLDPSTSSVWFDNSEQKHPIFDDYYIWRDGKHDKEPPNNWKSVGGNHSAWQYSPKRKQFYYAPVNQKPLLNFRNPNVTDAFSNVIKNFIEKGASGIMLKNAAHLLVSPKFEDETPRTNVNFGLEDYGFYTHTKTEYLEDLAPLIKEWRTAVNNNTRSKPLMVKEELQKVKAFKIGTELVVDLPLQSHAFNKETINVTDLVNSLNSSFSVDGVRWPLWKVNTSAVPEDALEIVTYLLPGCPLVQNGKVNHTLDELRDNSKSIMWGNTTYHAVANKTVFSFIREIPGSPGFIVSLNPTDDRVVVNFPLEIPILSKLTEVTIQMYSANYNETEYMQHNAKKDATLVPISPKSALVLSYVPHKD
ncbi:unnamed protein product [Brassicogethes aeneus]|uniref:alpha-glucosidase n=1 Tax=Brassicogethes aeneus TaxID=1431903 RepID=A0A9P0FEW7_BRAAE|nr:unnamed protein product [Brassicogethes aeneus]